jgi:signal transduction histidine kinase
MSPTFHRRAAAHPQLEDAALALLVVTVILLAVRFGPQDRYAGRLGAEDYVTGVLAFLFIAARRRWPLPVYAAVVVTSTAFNLHAAPNGPLLAANVITLYTVVAWRKRTNRRTAVWAAAITVATVYVAVVIGAGRTWTDPVNYSIIAWGVVAAAVGDAVRSRRGHLRGVEQRAREAEHGREEEARRRVVEERLRVARDLHDVVAHHIAVINVQVGVASHLLRDRPDDAEAALAHVRQAARTVLSELSTVLDVLRSAEPGDGIEPPPGLSRLPQLLESLAAVGLHVESRQDGNARSLPSAVDLAAYRVVQEALTNAHKHGSSATARLCLAYPPEGLRILIENAVERHRTYPGGTGHGLVGLRERVTSIGGTVHAAHEKNGLFTVDAFLPVPREPVSREEGPRS